MSNAMEWSHDYCLSCDNQISEGAYCSQACRLADLEKAGHSEPNSPSYLSSSATSASSYASNHSTASSAGFRLPPALNFAAYRPASNTRQDYATYSPAHSSAANTAASAHYSSYYYYSQQSPTYSYAAHVDESDRPQRSLSPSSSRSSLASISSYQQTQGMSPQAANALRGYVSSFDQVRDTKRRLHRQA